MRRPLAFVCSLIVILISVLVYAGILPINRILSLPEDGEYVTLTGRVDGIYEKYIVIKANDGLQYIKLLVYIGSESDTEGLRLGETLTVSGRFESFPHAMNPGQFDAYDYYTSKGYEAKLTDAQILNRCGTCAPVKEALRRLRLKMKERIHAVCPEKEASVLCDLLLGDKEGIDKETKELYQNNGIAHILSISGLHISILGMGCFSLLRKLRCRHIPAALASAGILILYLIMSGMSVSATRAVGMFVIRMLAFPAKRTEDPLTSLSVMAAGVLILDPGSIRNVSFLLSYGAALGIYTFLPSLNVLVFTGKEKQRFYEEDTLKKRLRDLSRKIASAALHSFVSSLGIILFTLPVQLYFFYRVSIYAVFLNLLILPCMSLLVFSGMILMVPGLGFVGKLSCLLLSIFEFLCRCAEKLPNHNWNPGRPGMAFIALYYMIVIALIITGRMVSAFRKGYILDMLPYFSGKGKRRIRKVNGITQKADDGRIRPAFILTVLCSALMLVLIAFPLPVRNSCTQLYIGQGNCNVMITDAGEVYIFDGGSSSERNTGQYIILPFLRCNGLSTVDGIFISHSDEDHINGVLELMENADTWNLNIRGVYITPQMRSDGSANTEHLLKACAAAGVPVTCISAGDAWKSGDTYFTCLHPASTYIPEDPNAGSMCILAEFHAHAVSEPGESPGTSFSLLIPGDVQESGETALAEAINTALGGRRLDIYITAHHGSSGTTTDDFLEAARPRLAVNSAGLDNRYGHPHPETLERLKNAGCTYLTTFETGAINLYFSGEDVQFDQFKKGIC
jgi:competence protein ComEC